MTIFLLKLDYYICLNGIIVKESEVELCKLRLKQPVRLKKRIDLLLVLKRSEITLSKLELAKILKINHNTAQKWRNLYFEKGMDSPLFYGRIGFKPSIISKELHLNTGKIEFSKRCFYFL